MYDFSIVKPYVLNHLKANYWKVSAILSFDDAIGEAQLQFWTTIYRLQKNGSVIENEKHLMSLFKTSWSRHFITLANKNTRSIQFIDLQLEDEDFNLASQTLIGDLDNNGYIYSILSHASFEFKQVIGLMLKLPQDTLQLIHDAISKGSIDKANHIVCTMLRKDPNSKLLQRTMDYLRTD